MSKVLAINGGKPVLDKPLKVFYPAPLDEAEKKAALRVIESQKLSEFVAANNEYFLGGVEVKRFEKAFSDFFKVKHSVSFNSATTALHAAINALRIGPGDEVIVTPFSMSATASCILMNGAIPVFVDINKNDFCLDPSLIEEKITKRTKAIMVANIFGGPANLTEIVRIAKEHNLKVIEDNAQAPGAKHAGKFTGTIGDIGVFSFNIHKVIQAGEGGVLVTNNDKIALKAQLSRNHGEVVADQMDELEEKAILGSNYRMSEIHAAICYEQLLKLDKLNAIRIELVNYLAEKLVEIDGLELPQVANQNVHVFYVYPIKIDSNILGISRDKFAEAVTAEGFFMSKGYAKPLYLLPIFQEKKVFNDTNFPFESKYYDGVVDYNKGICPVCEKIHENELSYTTVCQYPNTKAEVDLFIEAIKKVITNKEELL